MTHMILRASIAALLASTAIATAQTATEEPSVAPPATEPATPPAAGDAPAGDTPAAELPQATQPEEFAPPAAGDPESDASGAPDVPLDTEQPSSPPAAESAPSDPIEAPSAPPVEDSSAPDPIVIDPAPPVEEAQAPATEAAPADPSEEAPPVGDAPEPAAAPEPTITPVEERTAQPLPHVGADWPYWGGNSDATRFSPLGQITPENVDQLERAFVYRTGDMPTGNAEGKYAGETTPLKVGDQLLMCSAMNIMIAIDAATGEENWRYNPEVSNEAIPYSASCRGVSVYTAPDLAEDAQCKTRVIQGTIDARLIAVDIMTGEPCADFGTDGQVDLWEGIGEKVPGWYAVTAPPAIVRGVVVTGAQVKDGQAEDAPSGVIRGYDAVTGDFIWAWDLGNPGYYGQPPEGETYTRGTPNMWTTATADEELGLVYLPMGNSSVDYYGSNRSELEDQWATALVALDALTGEPAWSFQTVRNDVWDYDLGSQATLIDFPTDGGTTPAIVLPSKQGDIYILDRETGESLVPVGEVEAPTEGSVEPDYLAETQPTSEWHTLRKDNLVEQDMWGFTPLDQLWCRIQFRRANYEGFYTPPSADRPWIQYPGYNGGSDWGSVAIDPDRKIIVANYNNVPNFNQLIPREEANERGLKPIYAKDAGGGGGAEGAGDPQIGSPYAINVNAGWRNVATGVPCTQPPYGGIRAIDMETGETLWDTPIGTARRNGPFGIPSYLPFKIGTPNNGGSVLTESGLIFIGAATDNLFRAIDIETGETLWSDVLPAGPQANPISYEVDGEQYVLISAMGHHFMETPVGDYIIAYKLPE